MLYPLDGLARVRRVACFEAADQAHVLPRGQLTGRQYASDAWRVDGHRFLGEYVYAGFDAGFDVRGAKMRWLCQDDNIHAAVQQTFVTVEAIETARRIDQSAVAGTALEHAAGEFHAIGERIGQGCQPGFWIDGQRAGNRTASAAAATDQPDSQWLGVVGTGRSLRCQAYGGRTGQGGRTLQEVPSGSIDCRLGGGMTHR